MRTAAEALRTRPQLKREVFMRGDPQAVKIVSSSQLEGDLYGLMKAYAEQRRSHTARTYQPTAPVSYTLEQARLHLRGLLEDLTTSMGITARPVAVRITRWADAFPQYRPGHGDLVGQVTEQLGVDAPQVRLAGMAYEGVGIPASIGSGRRAAATLAARLS